MASSCSNHNRVVEHGRSRLTVYEPHEKRKRPNQKDDTLPTTQEEKAPYVIVVQGPRNVGKSLLIKSLVKYYTNNQHLDDIQQGPVVTVVLGELRRVQFVECPNNVNGMIDAAKYADLVLLLVDAAFGYEMDTFEFLNLLQVHGFPNVAGVLTHLDEFIDEEKLSETKQRLGRQFRKEINDGAELFYLSQLNNGMYQDCQIHKLAAFISAMKFYPVPCRAVQPYMLVDRFEDVTPSERVHIDKKCDRKIFLYGYLRGCNMKRGTKVHIAGVGDFSINGITSVIDPYPLLSVDNRNNLDEVTRLDMESFRTGTYIRLEIHDVSFGIAENFDPCHPILVGGISLEEEKVGYLQEGKSDVVSMHGTTILGAINSKCIYLASDSMLNCLRHIHIDGVLTPQKTIQLNGDKIFELNNGVVAATSGGELWYNKILQLLNGTIDSGQVMTPSACAEFTNNYINFSGFRGGPGLPPDFNIDDTESCDILFAGFIPDHNNEEGLRPSLFYGGPDLVVEIIDQSRSFTEEFDLLPENFQTTFTTHGTGGDAAEKKMIGFEESLANIDLPQYEHARRLLVAMRAAFKADPLNTGGFVQVCCISRDGIKRSKFSQNLDKHIDKLKNHANKMMRIRRRRMWKMICKMNRFRRVKE